MFFPVRDLFGEAPDHLPCTPAMSRGRKLSVLRCCVLGRRPPLAASPLAVGELNVSTFKRHEDSQFPLPLLTGLQPLIEDGRYMATSPLGLWREHPFLVVSIASRSRLSP
jgi:hypothetical protein